MSVRQRRYSKEELAYRGRSLYKSSIRSQVEAGNEGKIVAIDIETGAFELLKLLIMFCQQPTNYSSDTLMLNLGSSALDILLFITLAHGV